MNFSIEPTKKNAAIFRKMTDEEDYQGAMKARQAFAAFIREPLLEVINAYPGLQRLYTPYSYNEGEPNTIPMDQYFDIRDAGFYRTWSQSRAGGLATSRNEDVSELPVSVYSVDSALSLSLSFLRAARVDAIAKALNHSSQNFIKKTETNSAAVLCSMAAQTTYQLRGTATNQVYRSITQGSVIPQDINALNRIMARVTTANIGGTPEGNSKAIDALVGSPEFVEGVRNLAFQALNTNNTGGALGGPDGFRNSIYNAAGNPDFMGTEIITLNDLGINQAYNILFAEAAGGTTYAGYNAGSAKIFSPGSEQCVFAVNRKVESLARLSERGSNGSQMKVMADNQFTNREEKIGYFMKMKEGRVGLDGRGILTLVF